MKVKLILGAAMVAMWAMPVQAAPKVYAAGGANYCPNGLQPITLNGVICCGTPNQSMSYRQMMAHPVKKAVRKKARWASPAPVYCPEGAKGCYSR